MTVPSYAKSKELDALLRSFYIADISAENVELVKESTATIYSYAYDKFDMIKKVIADSASMSITVAFIDIGHCKTSMIVVKFEKKVIDNNDANNTIRIQARLLID